MTDENTTDAGEQSDGGPDPRHATVVAVLRQTGADAAGHDRDTLATLILAGLDNPDTIDTIGNRPTDEHGNEVAAPAPADTTTDE